MNVLQEISGSLSLFLTQTAIFIMNLLVAYVIWLIGNYVINFAVKLVQKADIRKWSLDDQVRNTIIDIGVPTAKVVLVLVILDYLGIGSSIVGAIAQGITFTIAIMLGISFGDALKPEARKVVDQIKNNMNEKR